MGIDLPKVTIKVPAGFLFTGCKTRTQGSACSGLITSPASSFHSHSQAKHAPTSAPLHLCFPLPRVFSRLLMGPSSLFQLQCHLPTNACSGQLAHRNQHLPTPCHPTRFDFLHGCQGYLAALSLSIRLLILSLHLPECSANFTASSEPGTEFCSVNTEWMK